MEKSYVVIQYWMSQELKLSGNDLLVYALIFGFSQDGESSFYGSRKYISTMFNISLPTVDKALRSLIDKNLIEKEERSVNGIKFNTYKIVLYPIKNLYTPYKESLPNNIVNKDNYISNKLDNSYNKNSILSKDNNTITEFEFGKKKPKKESLYTKCINLIDEKTNNSEVRKLLIQWLDMLLEKYRDKGRQLYLNVFKGKLNMLDKFDSKDWKDIVEYNLQKGYEGFYPIPLYNNTGLESERGVISKGYSEEDKKRLKALDEERKRNGIRTEF